MSTMDKIIPLLGQLVAAAAVIGTNQATIKAEIAPLKMDQEIINLKINGLSEKVGRIEKKVGE